MDESGLRESVNVGMGFPELDMGKFHTDADAGRDPPNYQPTSMLCALTQDPTANSHPNVFFWHPHAMSDFSQPLATEAP